LQISATDVWGTDFPLVHRGPGNGVGPPFELVYLSRTYWRHL